MHSLKLDLKPKLRRLIIASVKNISGSAPGMGAITRMAGERKSQLFRGKGLEFDRYREFTPDDDATLIDWKATLRSGKLLVKSYSEEQNKDIFILFDVSSTMTYGSRNKLKAEYAAELISSLAFSIVEAGDNVGLIMFTDKPVGVIPSMAGIGQYHKIARMLSNPKLYDGKFDIVKTAQFLAGIIKRQSIIILISDFIGLKGDWKRSLEILTGKNEIIGMMIRDPLDDKLPEMTGQVVLSDPFDGEQMLIEPGRIAEEYEKLNKARVNEIRNFFSKIQSDILVLRSDEDFTRPVRNFFMGG